MCFKKFLASRPLDGVQFGPVKLVNNLGQEGDAGCSVSKLMLTHQFASLVSTQC